MLISPSTKLTAALFVGLLIAAGAMRHQRDEARTALATYRDEVDEATAQAEAQARAKEAHLRGYAEYFRTAFEKESQHAEAEKNRLLAGIRAGTQRLSIAARCPVAGQTGADSATSPRTGDTARAELDPETAETLVGIAADGDAAIRERNACIGQYNAVRQLISGE